ncbi:transcription factor RFX3 isoform X2 [Harmonia axyridis]|uniref:transcription factor RFX3 isoform X2 n=1 Tax=Harmonia axyridis TaxID=115357 RepID=UPI001E277108|nr:transcription factor RFX3 isoform X2 [Harmonia axyridis]XP_045475336.1 transcription factor RFX3 isoform X2 [Harmonia axyridis]
MATAARFTAGGSSSPPTPAPATTPPVQPQTTQLIVLPASLHQAGAAGTIVNGVPVIDVSALEQAAESSNESTATGEHHSEAHETDPIGQSSPHFITVTVAEGDAVASHQGYHIQYVEPEIYATQTGGGQAQMAYPVYTVGESGTLYSAGQNQYYAATNTGAAAPTATVGYTTGGHYVVQQAVDTESLITSRNSPQTSNAETTYVATATVHASQSSSQVSTEDIGSGIGHATRVSPATVQWLLENYETAEGVSLPRSTLYAHYLRHCGDHKLEPVNAASFGKLIRSVFLGLRTRRLGTRGNSKYHYYGIRVKPGSSLVNVDDSGNRVSVASTSSGKPQTTIRPFKRSGESSEATVSLMLSQHITYLGDGSNAIPPFPDMLFNEQLPDDCSFDDVDTLKSIYREHLEAFLDAVLSLEFTTVESLWREFWRSQYNNNGDECEEEKYLSKSKLFSLCSLEPVQSFMKQVDLMFYQNLIQVLVPDVLKPIPATLTQSIRNFAKNLESWLTSAMSGAPPAMLSVKLSAVSAFSSSLRRYTSLNHLAQAARAVLHNTTQISQMLADLNRVDFNSVREQASWVCQCENDILARFESDFKLTLQQQNSLEQWASWLKVVVKKALKPYEGKPSFSKAARQFLLKWSFYSSMVIRDLTLRSAASFGSFHLIRLLYDEYMFYLIEHQVAEATGCVPIAVISEGIKQDIMQNNISMFPGDGLCNGMINTKLGCQSPSDTKRQKIS